jgi:hypothetical protein
MMALSRVNSQVILSQRKKMKRIRRKSMKKSQMIRDLGIDDICISISISIRDHTNFYLILQFWRNK